jgi:hypothetical protein
MSQARFLELSMTPIRYDRPKFTNIVRQLCLKVHCFTLLFVFHDSPQQLQVLLHAQNPRRHHHHLGNYIMLHHLQLWAYHRMVYNNHHLHEYSSVKRLHICWSCIFDAYFTPTDTLVR